MSIGRIDINEKDLGKICTAIIQLQERQDPITDFITTLLNDPDAATARTTLGVSVPGLVFITSSTASNSATLDFIGIDSTYDEYLFIGSNLICGTDSVDLWIRVSEDNGSTFKSGAGDYRWTVFTDTDAPATGNAGSTSDVKITVLNSQSNSATRPFAFHASLFNPFNATKPKLFMFDAASINVTPNLVRWAGSGAYIGTNNAINAVRFLMSSGNIVSGVVYMYGVRKV